MIETFKKDIIEAMKAKDKLKLDVLRMVKANILQEVIDNKRNEDDTLLIDVVSRQIKMRKESISEFIKANRNDLADITNKEIEILVKYLPEQLNHEEIVKEIDLIFDELKPTGMRDMGKVMGAATAKLKGKVDMSEVSSIIKEKLINL